MGAAAEPEGAALYLDRDMSEAELRVVAGGTAAIYSARCPGRDSGNQDAAAVLPFGSDALVLLVADGVGGERAGRRAAAIAVRGMKASLAEAARKGGLLRTAVLDGIERANRAVCELGLGAATTLAAVELQEGVARPYHVGDSMILLVGQRGRVKLQTVPHSPVGFALESGMLDEHEAMHHVDRHVVSNVLGSPDMRIEMGPARRLAPRDTLLLASDGLADNLRKREIVERIRIGSLRAVARRLAADARARMQRALPDAPCKPDDLTFVGFRPRAAD